MKKRTKKQMDNIGYTITQIKTHKIGLVEPDHVDLDSMTVTGQMNFWVKAIDENRAEVMFDVVTEFIDPDTNEVLISHTGRTKYEIVNVEIPEDRETIGLPDQLVVMLYAMAHSHARALLAGDLQNTMYKDKVFIPVVDPKNILQMTATS